MLEESAAKTQQRDTEGRPPQSEEATVDLSEHITQQIHSQREHRLSVIQVIENAILEIETNLEIDDPSEYAIAVQIKQTEKLLELPEKIIGTDVRKQIYIISKEAAALYRATDIPEGPVKDSGLDGVYISKHWKVFKPESEKLLTTLKGKLAEIMAVESTSNQNKGVMSRGHQMATNFP